MKGQGNETIGECICEDGWTGRYCDVDVECDNPVPVCENRGVVASCSPFSGDFECQCQGAWGGVTCSACNLNCNGGNANDDCTQCECDANHGGVFCEWSFDDYSVVLEILIAYIPDDAMGRFKRLFEYDVAFALRIHVNRIEVRDVVTIGGAISVDFRLYVNLGQNSQIFYEDLLRQGEAPRESTVLYRGETTQFWKHIICRGEKCDGDPYFISGIPLTQNEFIGVVSGAIVLLILCSACWYRVYMKRKDLPRSMSFRRGRD